MKRTSGRYSGRERVVAEEEEEAPLRAMRIFSGNANPALGAAICQYLGQKPGEIHVGQFADGETEVRIEEDIRGRDIFIVQPTVPKVNENLMELLVMVDAFRRASAARITAVMPYFGYARQDRKHEGRVPITAKLVANMIVSAGVDRVLCMDLHASQIQGFFDIRVDHLYARPVILEYLRGKNMERPVIMSPDTGRLKMADGLSNRLNGDLAVIDKRRVSDTDIETGHVIGDVRGRNVIILDDMISTGGSMQAAIDISRENGANHVIVVVTHGLFVGPAWDRLVASAPDEIVVTDTIPLREKPPSELNLTVLSVADLLGEAIDRIHNNRSVSLLFGDG